jgi:hypothetical protein
LARAAITVELLKQIIFQGNGKANDVRHDVWGTGGMDSLG